MLNKNRFDNSKIVDLGDYKIGGNNPIFIIAEIGLNHNQNLEMAIEMIDVAVDTGCSAAKFQTFQANEVYVQSSAAGNYSLMGKSIPIYSLHESLEMPEDWVHILKKYCDDKKILFFSSPIGKYSADLLQQIEVRAIKISSYECTNVPYVRYLAKKGIPIILSTGACTLSEVERAVNIIEGEGTPVAIMHCVTKYPAEFKSANLNVMHTLRSAFQTPVGFSNNGFMDKSGNIDSSLVPQEAARMGADLFEIHITLDRKLPGPDHGFATEPHELAEIVKTMNVARSEYLAGKEFISNELVSGSSIKKTYPEEKYVRDFAFKTIFATRDIEIGELLTSDNTGVLRPGEAARGIEPEFYEILLNNCAVARKIPAWEPITWDHVLNQ